MSFEVSPEAYDRFMGRFSVPLAHEFVRFSEVGAGERVLDVGCGPGALTAELVGLDAQVTAVDPSGPFVAAVGARLPEADVRQATAEHLPFDDAGFDRALAQLAVHFFDDPAAGLREMRRVTRRDGLVAAAVWDFGASGTPLAVFWEAAQRVDPSAQGEAWRAGTLQGELGELMRTAGLRDVEESVLVVSASFDSFDDWWDPFLLGVGPAGAYVGAADAETQGLLREQCRALLPAAPFTQQIPAWVARGLV